MKDFRLVGGTALALQLGHRLSVDLDFFRYDDGNTITHSDLFDAFQTTEKEVISLQNTLNINMFQIDGVKTDIVNYPYDWLEPAVEEKGLRLANLKDIAAMKLSAITNRGTKKDFVDLFFLLKRFTLAEMLVFYNTKFRTDSTFNVLLS